MLVLSIYPVQGIEFGPYEPGGQYYVSVYNIDDTGTVFVNDVVVVSVGYMQESGMVDISNFISTGSNSVRFVNTNDQGGVYAYGFKLIKDGGIIWSDSCGKVGNFLSRKSCNNGMNGYDNTIILDIKSPVSAIVDNIYKSSGFEFFLSAMGIIGVMIYYKKRYKKVNIKKCYNRINIK